MYIVDCTVTVYTYIICPTPLPATNGWREVVGGQLKVHLVEPERRHSIYTTTWGESNTPAGEGGRGRAISNGETGSSVFE